MGDIFRSVGYPYADLANGGSLAGLLEGLSEVVDRAGPSTKIIPGHGPIVDRNAVLAQRDLIITVRGRVQKLVDQGMTLEQVIAAHPTADLDARVRQPAAGAPSSRDGFVTWVYKEVVANR